MRYNDYQSVAQLTESQQRALLQSGDAVECVWAVWALALRDGAALRPELDQWLYREPDPGTRRQMIVLLAGARAYDTIVERLHTPRKTSLRYPTEAMSF